MSEFSTQLKVLSLESSELETGLSSKEKEIVDDIKSLGAEHNEVLNVVATLKLETSEKERICKAMIDELKVLEAYKGSKAKELADYLVEQSEVFAYISKTQQEVSEKHLEYGNEIAYMIQSFLK